MIDDEDLGPFWESVGQAISTYLDDDVEGVFLYLECDPATIGGQMYRERLTDIEQIAIPDVIMDLVMNHWEALTFDKRWTSVRFSISGGKFNVVFDYPVGPADQIDETRGSLASMLAIVRQHYSNKSIRPVTDKEWRGSTRTAQ